MTKIAAIPKAVTKINWGTAGSVVVGMILFGGLIYGVTRLPTNDITRPIKKVAATVSV